jgi:hypothetical protein
VAQGREVLLQRDDYVRATAPLERRMHLKSRAEVDQDAFMRHQASLVLEWPPAAQRRLAEGIERLRRFIAPVKARWPDKVLLVRTDQRLEDGAAFTRANAIFLLDEIIATPMMMHYLLAHEAFHVLSRSDPALRARLYAMLGFERCEKLSIPEGKARLRLSNPDVIENIHTIRVRYKGEALHALPFNRFASADPDPAKGVFAQIENRWLLVDRKGGDCRARDADAEPEDLEGLFEQVGRNTEYLFHPEEILADNFALLFMAEVSGRMPPLPSPEILEKLRKELFR